MTIELNSMEQSILKTLAYFDLFGYPLTLLELSIFLQTESGDKKIGTPGEIVKVYEASAFLKSKISFERGFFYFTEREELIARRQQRYNVADKKYKIALRALKVMRLLPSVRSVMICNSLSFYNSSEQSDIDLFLIVEPHAIWLTRLVLIAISELLGVRIHAGQTQDKLCLSFFTCVGNYNFMKIAVPNHDIYLQYWLATLSPILGESAYHDFIRANSGLFAELPNFTPKKISSRRSLKISRSSIWQSLIVKIMSLFEVWAKKLQLGKMAPYKLALAQAEGSELILSDQMLKFHDNDRRWLYQQQYLKRYRELIEN